MVSHSSVTTSPKKNHSFLQSPQHLKISKKSVDKNKKSSKREVENVSKNLSNLLKSKSSSSKSRKSCSSSGNKKPSKLGRWTEREHEQFLECLKKYGREWKKVATVITTRTSAQIRSHAQKYFIRMKKSGTDPESLTVKNIGQTKSSNKRGAPIPKREIIQSPKKSIPLTRRPFSPFSHNSSTIPIPPKRDFSSLSKEGNTCFIPGKKSCTDSKNIPNSTITTSSKSAKRKKKNTRNNSKHRAKAIIATREATQEITKLLVERRRLCKSLSQDLGNKEERMVNIINPQYMYNKNRIISIDREICSIYTNVVGMRSARGHEEAVARKLLNFIVPNQKKFPTYDSSILKKILNNLNLSMESNYVLQVNLLFPRTYRPGGTSVNIKSAQERVSCMDKSEVLAIEVLSKILKNN